MKRAGFVVLIILALVSWSGVSESRAYECQLHDTNCELIEIERELAELDKLRQMSESATSNLEERVEELEGQISSLQGRINRVREEIGLGEKEVERLALEVAKGESERERQIMILSSHVRRFYKNNRGESFLRAFLGDVSGRGVSEAGDRALAIEDRTIISRISATIAALLEKKTKLAERKVELEGENRRLVLAQANLDREADFLKGEISEAKAWQTELSSKITELSKRQKDILAQKTGSFLTSVGEVPPVDDPASQIDYNPGFSPAYAMFSFGSPHRVGMSQYGALGRARAGQSAEDILKAYYDGVEIKRDYPVPSNILVDGYGSISFEDLYLKGIAEMPSKWGDEGGMEALKAQVVAARTYALAVTNNGSSSICATESCQVFIGHNKGGKWEEAVNATRGWVIVKDGSPIKAYYASTSGGFTRSSADVWGRHLSYVVGIKDVANGGSWPDEAYEGSKYGRSPWFYKGWYKTRSGKSCGRSHPWLNESEFLDIVNAAQVYKNDKGVVGHLSQLDAESCWGESISDTWSVEEIREEAAKYGGPVNSISSIGDTEYSTSGYTLRVKLNTDKGEISFSGEEFAFVFNLRAPGTLHVKSGAFFNIERK